MVRRRRRRNAAGDDGGASAANGSAAGGSAAGGSAAGGSAAGGSAAGGASAGGSSGKAKAPLTAAKARRLIGVGTAVAPMLAPYALAAAGAVRERWDAYRAARLGVAPGELAAYSGRGGALHARISRIAEGLAELDSESEVHAGTAARAFAIRTRPRMADLAVAIRAAEQMPAQRRRAAFTAIGRELDRVEVELLGHLGITTS